MCENRHDPSKVKCVLCHNVGGPVKQTLDGHWCHITCAIWIPEIRFHDTGKPLRTHVFSAGAEESKGGGRRSHGPNACGAVLTLRLRPVFRPFSQEH